VVLPPPGQKESQGGGKMNILNKKIVFLRSTRSALLIRIQGSTTNTCDFLKFVIPVRGRNDCTRPGCQKCSQAAS